MTTPTEPVPFPPVPTDCRVCDRLVAFRESNRALYPDYFNAPVPAFSAPIDEVRLLVVGLAPGLKGANRTGRPFTGDWAGDLLYPTLIRHGWAKGSYDLRADDGLELVEARITNAVRCVPPENKPVGAEINACNNFLRQEIGGLPALRNIVALGGIAHGAVLKAMGLKKSAFKFAHGAKHEVAEGITLTDSYHCSRYNTNTGRLTEAMFDNVFSGLAAV